MNCRKHLRWTHNGKQHGKKAGTRSWVEAEERQRKLETQYESRPATTEQEQQTIESVAELFLASKTSQGVDTQVVKKYERELERLKDFCSNRAKVFVSEILLEDLVEFRAKWDQLYPTASANPLAGIPAILL